MRTRAFGRNTYPFSMLAASELASEGAQDACGEEVVCLRRPDEALIGRGYRPAFVDRALGSFARQVYVTS